jgi:hypothetical protein
MLEAAAQAAVQEIRPKQSPKVAAVARVREAEAAGAAGRAATIEARAPATLGPVYVFAQKMSLIQNRTLLIMQSRQIRDITRHGDLFDQEEVRKKFSNALVMVAAHSPEELEIFLLTTQRMAQSGHGERLASFFGQVTEALTDRLKKKTSDEDDEDVEGDSPFPMPQHEDDDLVLQIRQTLEKRFAAARERAVAMGVVTGEQPSESLSRILKAGHQMIEEADPAPETVLNLLTSESLR